MQRAVLPGPHWHEVIQTPNMNSSIAPSLFAATSIIGPLLHWLNRPPSQFGDGRAFVADLIFLIYPTQSLGVIDPDESLESVAGLPPVPLRGGICCTDWLFTRCWIFVHLRPTRSAAL